MKTNDPALTKTPISSHDAMGEMVDSTHEPTHANETVNNNVQADGRVIVNDAAAHDARAHNTATHNKVGHDTVNRREHDHEKLEENTEVNKGTDTFEDDIVDSEHVNDGDNPARQPDRRDQQGSSPFDGNVNDRTVKSAEPKSEEINDLNRYASIDNAQTRILNPDEKD